MVDVTPPDSNGAPYKGQYRVSPEFKKFWEQLFHHTKLSDKELKQMTDQFVKMAANQMNQVLKWALSQEKERHKKEKEERGG